MPAESGAAILVSNFREWKEDAADEKICAFPCCTSRSNVYLFIYFF